MKDCPLKAVGSFVAEEEKIKLSKTACSMPDFTKAVERSHMFE